MRGLGPADIGVAATRVNGESRREDLTTGRDGTVTAGAKSGTRRGELSTRGEEKS